MPGRGALPSRTPRRRSLRGLDEGAEVRDRMAAGGGPRGRRPWVRTTVAGPLREGCAMKSMRFEDLPDVLTAQEAAEVLRVGRNTVYDCLRSGAIPSLRLGRPLLIPKSALRRLLEGEGEPRE